MRFPYTPADLPENPVDFHKEAREEFWRIKRGLEDAGVLRTKKLTGTTNAAAGGTVTIAHGLTLSKIVGAQVLVGAAAGPRYALGSPTAANGFELFIGGVNAAITQGAAAGANVNNQPFTILLTYED
jgi:hypothetical protein